jgi:hypothetical protein
MPRDRLWPTCLLFGLACGARQPPSTTTATPKVEVEAGAVDDGSAPQAAVKSMDAAAAWAWLRSELPSETASFRLDDDGQALGSLLAWAPANGTVTAFDGTCRPVQLARNEATLDGDIDVHTKIAGSTKSVSGDSISFGTRVTMTCGFDQTYERADGGWALVQQSATGCDQDVGHRLSGVSADAASYDAVDAELENHCGARRDVAQHCSDGTSRTCSSCERLAFDVSSREGHFHEAKGTIVAKDAKATESVDCSRPCPPDERGANIGPANAALARARLETIRPERPLLFRTIAACRAWPRH